MRVMVDQSYCPYCRCEMFLNGVLEGFCAASLPCSWQGLHHATTRNRIWDQCSVRRFILTVSTAFILMFFLKSFSMVSKLFILAAYWNSLSSGSTVQKHDEKNVLLKKIAISNLRHYCTVLTFCYLSWFHMLWELFASHHRSVPGLHFSPLETSGLCF